MPNRCVTAGRNLYCWSSARRYPSPARRITEGKHLRIVTLSSTSTAAYGVSNPVYAYPTQLNIGLEKALPGVGIEVMSCVVSEQNFEGYASTYAR